jgi:uncharacterized cofD-like protein
MNPRQLPLAADHPLQAPCPASRRPRIVAIGGGTGLPSVLKGLRASFTAPNGDHDPDSRDAITAIVTVTDDGGSSGRLRRELGILPPGDVRNCLAALAPDSSSLTSLLQHRFSSGNGLNGHSVGNLMLAALTEMDGDFLSAIDKMSELLECRGRVLPSSLERVSLRADFDGGERVEGETAIVAQRRRIARLELERRVKPLPDSLRALVNADAVVIGPGSLYTSILPNLLVDGIAPTLSGIDAVRIYVANLMTQPGETDGFTLEDHLDAIRSHVGCDPFDYVLINGLPASEAVIARYAEQGSHPVQRSTTGPWIGAARVVERDLAWHETEDAIRHDPVDLASAILDLASTGRPRSATVHQLADHAHHSGSR